MGLVTDVMWNCPGCGSRERAQLYGRWHDPSEFPVHAVPSDRELKWNPPCTKCGKFQLMEPHRAPVIPVAYRAVPVPDEPEEKEPD